MPKLSSTPVANRRWSLGSFIGCSFSVMHVQFHSTLKATEFTLLADNIYIYIYRKPLFLLKLRIFTNLKI